MDMGHTIGKESKTATNVVDLSAYRCKNKTNPANATKMEQSRPVCQMRSFYHFRTVASRERG